MSRDHRKLRVFVLADELAVAVYRCTCGLPAEERFGLQSQLRRAAVSVPTNIVEGCTRQSTKGYAHFMTTALGSASQVRYRLNLTARLYEVGADHAKLDKAQPSTKMRGYLRPGTAIAHHLPEQELHS